MFCSNCGKKLPDDALFCSDCGSRVNAGGDIPVNRELGAPMEGGIKVGFSEKVNDPKLMEMMKKTNRSAGIFFLICLPIPILVTFVIGLTKGDFGLMPTGFFISAVFLVINLISFVKKKSKKQWDGVVIDKKTVHHRRDRENGDRSYDEYIVVFREESGKKRKLREGTSGSTAHPYYDYLNIGDRVRYHPQFNQFYEKHDKTRDSYVFCAICGKTNDISEAHCHFCQAPLVK